MADRGRRYQPGRHPFGMAQSGKRRRNQRKDDIAVSLVILLA
ncbi:hypothetical protein [Mesorhizobium sp. M2E.F.Ca.ET.209.01.1.1]|jgi:hypothetical protein|nr:hypothetical protein [Mesorhizobium sp. M2E.F.Ca.ET.209.01.1.1]